MTLVDSHCLGAMHVRWNSSRRAQKASVASERFCLNIQVGILDVPLLVFTCEYTNYLVNNIRFVYTSISAVLSAPGCDASKGRTE